MTSKVYSGIPFRLISRAFIGLSYLLVDLTVVDYIMRFGWHWPSGPLLVFTGVVCPVITYNAARAWGDKSRNAEVTPTWMLAYLTYKATSFTAIAALVVGQIMGYSAHDIFWMVAAAIAVPFLSYYDTRQ